MKKKVPQIILLGLHTHLTQGHGQRRENKQKNILKSNHKSAIRVYVYVCVNKAQSLCFGINLFYLMKTNISPESYKMIIVSFSFEKWIIFIICFQL